MQKASKPPPTKTLEAAHVLPPAASLPYYASSTHQKTTFNRQKSALGVTTKTSQQLGGDRGHSQVRGAWPPAQPKSVGSFQQSVGQSHSPSRPRSGQKSIHSTQQQKQTSAMDGFVVTSARIVCLLSLIIVKVYM